MTPWAETCPAPQAGAMPGRDPAIGLAHAAMESLLRHKISPLPENYLLWFRFHEGADAGLRAAMQERLDAAGTLDASELRALHARFCAAEAPLAAGSAPLLAIGQVSRQLEAALNDAAVMLGTAHDDAARYGTRLEGLSGTLEAALPSLDDALRRILADTQALCRSSRCLATRLAERAREAEALRGALQEARRAALTDPLTGLPNRRAFEERLDETLARAGAGRWSFCLLLLDLDHFKSVNDRHGHLAGDAVLRRLAELLRAWARPHDWLARLGGEEFAALLPATPMEEALAHAEALRRAVAGEVFPLGQEGPGLTVTLSAGIAQHRQGEAGEALLGRADAALYAAKRQGRDRVVTDPPAAAATPAVAWR